MAEDVKSKMNNNPKLVPSPWSRNTVADGSWMQKHTLDPLSSRDDFLADEISGVQYSIDLLKAANDVICVYGTYDEFTANSGNLTQLSDNDFIKVLRDNHYQPDESDPDYNTNDDDKYQVYYEYHISAHDGWDGWSAIGALDPYYSCDEIDDIVDDISATVSNNYLSANTDAVIPGKNIVIEEDGTAPKITIGTDDDVSFDNVSSTNISATYVTAINLSSTNVSAKNLSATNVSANALSSTTISSNELSSTKISAYSLSAQTISSLSASGISAVFTGISAQGITSTNFDIDTINAENITATAISAYQLTANSASGQSANFITGYFTNLTGSSVSAKTITGTSAKFDGYSGTNISGDGKNASIKNLIISAEGGSAANAWINNNTTDNSANSAINATNADHTKDVITSYYATETQAGTQTATFNVSSLKLSGNKTAGVEISKTTNSNVDYLYFKLNSGTVCDFVEVQNKYVKYTDVNLGIGNKTTLTANSNSTALGQYAAASTQSISFGFGGDASQINSASIKSFAVGDTNSANSFSYVFGNNNSADSLGFILGTNNTAGTASYVIGSNNKATNGGYIIGNNNTVTEQSIVLGNYAYTVAGQNNLLYVGANNNTDRNNALLLNNNNLKLFNNMVSLDNTKGILFRGSNFIPYKELLGVSGYDSMFDSATNTDELIANQIYLYGTNYSNNHYNIFVDNLGANSHHFVFAPMLYSAYHFTFGVPVDYDICIKGVRLNQWPIDDTSNLSATFTDNAYIPAPGGEGFHWATAFPPNDLYFVRNTFSYTNKNYVFFHINRLFGNQELNITIDYESKAFILIKGAGVNAGSSS